MFRLHILYIGIISDILGRTHKTWLNNINEIILDFVLVCTNCLDKYSKYL